MSTTRGGGNTVHVNTRPEVVWRAHNERVVSTQSHRASETKHLETSTIARKSKWPLRVVFHSIPAVATPSAEVGASASPGAAVWEKPAPAPLPRLCIVIAPDRASARVQSGPRAAGVARHRSRVTRERAAACQCAAVRSPRVLSSDDWQSELSSRAQTGTSTGGETSDDAYRLCAHAPIPGPPSARWPDASGERR